MHLHELGMNLFESETLESKIGLVQKLINVIEYVGEVPPEARTNEWELAFQILAASKPIDYPGAHDLMLLISRVESKTRHTHNLTSSLVDYGINAGVIGKTITALHALQNSLTEYEAEYKQVNFILDLFDEILAHAFGNHYDGVDKFKQKMAQTTLKKLGLDHLLN